MLKVSPILKVKELPVRTMKPGDFFFIPRGSLHGLEALKGSEGGVALSTWIVDKDKPLADSLHERRWRREYLALRGSHFAAGQ